MSGGNPKYVIVENEFGVETALLFESSIKHIDAAWYFHKSHMVVSAGFYSTDGKNVHAYGKSESLRIDSRPEDKFLVAKVLGITLPAAKPFTCDEKKGTRCTEQCTPCKERDNVSKSS